MSTQLWRLDATRFEAADLARIAVFAALIAVLGLPGAINVGVVPITLQTLGVMLAGAVLGPLRGAAAVATFIALVAVGLPLLSGGRGGLGVFAGPTAGYLTGWLLGVIVIGLIVRAGARRAGAGRAGASGPSWWRVALGAIVGGILAIYAVGIPVQSLITGMPLGETVVTSLIFLPGDLIKVVLTVIVSMALWRAYPAAFRWPVPAKNAQTEHRDAV
ncbi:BioY family transporter [Gulosibacter macacae]|uniref:Biotin transporter n=1 Tax=Gulosibacter macacae TaxID=2488791 RepID=A0A3P3W012_9MICO|nr:biotin transporter BioY [Gulosibacter macacae]RRJ87216.1 BioY family transporter [Gulosibacter macacae]